MKFFSNFFSAFSKCFRSFSIIFEKGLWPFLFYPIFIWAITWLLSLYGSDKLATFITDYLSFQNIPDSGSMFSFLKPFLTSGFFHLLLTWVIKLMLWFVTATFSKYILLIILSPLFAYLSERTEEIITGNKFKFSFTQLVKDIGRGILISLRNMLLEFGFIISSFILGIVFPPSLFVTTPLLLFVSWYYTGFSLLDYNNERHKMSFRDSITFVRNNNGYACGIGCVYWLFMLLPTLVGSVVGLMFGPAIAVIGATLVFLEIHKGKQ